MLFNLNLSIRASKRNCMILAAVAILTTDAFGRIPDKSKKLIEPVVMQTGTFDGDAQSTRIVFSEIITREGAPWIRIRFGEHNLGAGSFVTVMSVQDGRIQKHRATTLPEWNNWSAIFNGDAVEVTLHVAPGDEGVFIDLETVAFGEPDPTDHVPMQSNVASICGDSDNRTDSNDSRVGRLFWGGCTGWLISNAGVLTAGHCTDDSGDIGGVLEFSVPASTSNGRSVAADPEDQYPVNNGVAYQSNGTGADWALFTVGANADTGLRAHIAQGFFRLTDSAAAVDTTMRVTGYGLDNRPGGTGGANAACCDASNDDVCEYNCNSDSVTQQTHAGRLDDIEGYTIEHEADTLPANSGSPIIWESNGGLAMGIHTAGGCDSFVQGYNNFGTWFAHPTLASWVNDLRGSNAVYVDSSRNPVPPIGTVFKPFITVTTAVGAVANGGVVSIVEGSYPASAGNTFTAGTGNKAMTLEAPVGIVTIGN